MREIEFKAKRVDGGVWVYGYYCELAGRKYIIPDYSQFRDIYDADLENSFTEIIPETIGQFTGLKDKNGVKIFEGDVLKNDYGELWVVVWKGTEFMLSLNGDSKNIYYANEYYFSSCEVIGNIHDKAQQKQALIDIMRGDEQIGLYYDNPKNHGNER